jgi:hypothetical protein
MAGNRAVWLIGLLAVLGRFPSLLWPLRPDEAGYLLVAQSWSPEPDSLFGPYWVDRAPTMIALVRLADAMGGPYFLRALAALGCVAAVLLAAACGREVVRHLSDPPSVLPARVAIVPAAVTAALLCTPQIDSAAAKGEVLGVPVILAGCLLALRALRLRSGWAAFGAGLCAVGVLGLKQSLVGALVFGAVLLLGARVAGRLDWRTTGRLALAAAAGGGVPVALTAGWALLAGVHLSELWYAVVGFRGEANTVIVEGPSAAPLARAERLWVSFWGTGMGLVALWFLARLPRLVRRLPLVCVAVLAMLLGDLVGLALGGSFWRPYLFALVGPLALAAALAAIPAPRDGRVQLWTARIVPALCIASSVVSLTVWTHDWATRASPREYLMGHEIGRVALDGETMTVYGGRADIQWASGMDSPYPYLWSLPMRTLDPELDDLTALLESEDAPTWFVGAVHLDTWDIDGVPGLRATLNERYVRLGTFCGGLVVHRLRSAPEVEALRPHCHGTWRRTVWSASPAE